MINLKKLLFSLLVIVLPSQLGIHYWPNWSFVSGIRVDYLSPTFYLTDIILTSLLFVWLIESIKKNKYHTPSYSRKTVLIILATTILIVLNILFSAFLLLAIYKWARIAESLLLGFYVYKNKDEVKNLLSKFIPIALFWTTYLAISQWMRGGSLGGIFYYLGERSFTTSTPGIALTKIGSTVSLRPYATLPHPNALAGFILVLWLIWFDLSKKRNFSFWLVTAFCLTTIFLTESFAVWVAIACIFLVRLRPQIKSIKKPLVICLFVLSLLSPIIFSVFASETTKFSQNTRERIELAVMSGNMITKNPFLGVGLGGFIPQIPQVLGKLPAELHVRTPNLLQPTHSVPLLVVAETGIIGGMFLLFGVLQIPLTPVFVVIVVASLFDHYWMTLYQPLLLLAVVVGLSFVSSHKN